MQEGGHREPDQLLEPYWEKRAELRREPGRIWEILEQGNTGARKAAQKTMEDVRAAIGI